MNKKGELTFNEVIYIILSIPVILLLVGALVAIWNSTHQNQESQEKKDILRLISEIKDLDYDGEGGPDIITVPVFSKDNKVMVGQKSAFKNTAPKCNEDYCLCFIKADNTICETFNLRDEFIFQNKYCKDGDKKYKGIKFNGKSIIDGIKTNSPITITRDEPCNVIISNT